MRFFQVLFLMGIVASLTACQSLINEVDPDRIPKIDGKLVVQCYLSPQDTLLLATVSTSRPVLGSGGGYIGNAARVVLSEGNRSIELKFDEKLLAYLADPRQFPIEAGKTYQLRVDAQNQVVTASCTVPQGIPILSMQVDSMREEFWGGMSRWNYTMRMTWQDPPNQTNYYRAAGEASASQWVTIKLYKPGQTQPDTLKKFMFMRGMVFFEDDEQHFSDQTQDGQPITSPRGTLPQNLNYVYVDSANRSSYGGLVPISQRPITLTAQLLHVDKNYYDYHRTLQQQGDTEDNPFAEPVLVSTNIQGGLGCFGAYNRTKLSVVLK